jgi:phosphoserine phosphatase RsbU/P
LANVPDSAKKDLTLLIAGVLAAILFFRLYGDLHPLGAADHKLSETQVQGYASEWITSLGYGREAEPRVRYRMDKDLLDSLQIQTDLKEFFSDAANRKLYPGFYWEARYHTPGAEPEITDMAEGNRSHLTVTMNEDGEPIGLRNHENRLPGNFLDAGALSYLFEIEHPVISAEELDTLLFDRMQFSLSEDRITDRELEHGETTLLSRQDAQRLAEYHLMNTGWKDAGLNFIRAEKVSLDVTEAAKLIYKGEHEQVRQTVQVELTILPTGSLLSLTHSIESDEAVGMRLGQIISGTRGAVLMLVVFWLLILFIIRFRMRLIDTKAAILVAVLAGFMFPFVVLSQLVYEMYYSTGGFVSEMIFVILIAGGLTAAFSSLIFFLSTSISDSITRQNWPEKLQTIDLIRIGHFFNRPVGISFIRGVSYSFILAGLFSLMLYLFPGSYLTVESNFFSDRRFFGNIVMVFLSLTSFFLISQLIFLIFLGKIREKVSSSVILILITGFVFGLMNPLTIELGPVVQELAIYAVIGLVMGAIYLKDDYLTVFITLFFLFNHLFSAPGWLIQNSPDMALFVTNLILMAAGLMFGGYAIFQGKSVRELPKFVPEYVEELAQEERIKQELQIARKVQQSFLPVQTPRFDGLDIAAICKPAYETGGDYYDFIQLNGDRLGITIGDVSGKGIQAAFFMTFIKGVIHAVCENFSSTKEILARANKLFRQNARRGTFISLIFGVVDVKNARFTFSRAGHNPLLYYENDEKTLHSFTPAGLGLGIADTETFSTHISEQVIDFKDGDLLVLYTDGVVEAVDPKNSYYGEQRLRKLVKTFHEAGSETVLNKIVDDLNAFCEGANQHDDMTIVIIKKK